MTNKIQHTPGPWRVDGDEAIGDDIYAIIAGGDWNRLALVDATPLDDPEHQANARLIAAAPDLLAALEWIAGMTLESLTRHRARAAIAKARGEG